MELRCGSVLSFRAQRESDKGRPWRHWCSSIVHPTACISCRIGDRVQEECGVRNHWKPWLAMLFLVLALATCLLAWGSHDAGRLSLVLAQGGAFDADFTGRTMRVDYFHSGTATEEHISLDRIVADGPWPGSRTRPIDDLNLGKFLFEVTDRASNRLLYSRGFSSIYGEWETTGEAKKTWRTYHESLRFPWPKRQVQVTLKKRDAENVFREIWATAIDPNSRFVAFGSLQQLRFRALHPHLRQSHAA